MTALNETIRENTNMSTEPLTNDEVLSLILERIRISASIRAQWLRKVWTEAGARESANLQLTEIDGYLNNIDNRHEEHNWRIADESAQPQSRRLKEIENKLRDDQYSRLYQLSQIFHLEQGEMDALHACLALAMDANLGRVFAYLHDHTGRNYISVELVSRLFGCDQFSIVQPMATIMRWRLINVIDMGKNEPPALTCDPFILDWIMGVSRLDNHLQEIAAIQPRFAPLSHWPVDDTVLWIGRILNVQEDTPVRILVTGAEGSGRKTFSCAVCRKLALGLLTIHGERINDQEWPLIYLFAQRQAYLDQCAVLWTGVQGKAWPLNAPSFKLQFVIGETDDTFPPAHEVVEHRIELPPLPATEAINLWKKYIPEASHWPEVTLREMAQRQSATVGQIAHAAQKGVKILSEASASLKADARQRLGPLAHPLVGDFSWDDLILSETLRKHLEDFCFEATDRASLWERPEARRLFPQGRGLIALFTGSPGTGKTMASQVIANSLNLDLFRIDLSSTISKYVGETSKNIERILSRASRMDVVLLFDEADALFGKRTEIKDAHDRFANTDTNYLLQAIEEYPGIVILASNRKANIDAGFMRRLRYVLEFPKPDAQQRHKLWKHILKELVGAQIAAALDQDIRLLSEMLEITGAQIKMAILSALFMARRQRQDITIVHLLRGLERELAKEGRGPGRQVMETFKAAYHD